MGDDKDPNGSVEASTVTLHEVMPHLLTEMSLSGTLPFAYTRDREMTCLRPEDKAQQSKTHWIISAQATAADAGEGKSAVAAAEAQLKSAGWKLVDDQPLDPQGIAGVGFALGDATIGVEAIGGAGGTRVEVLAQTRCFENPEDHVMTRSPNDPDYGKSDPAYPNEGQ